MGATGGAGATVIRKKPAGSLIVNKTNLTKCSGFGDEKRASDPHIGGVVSQFARQQFFITLANPIGLYIEGVDTIGWTKPGPGGARVATGSEFWRVLRCDTAKGEILRAIYEIPAGTLQLDGQPLTVSDTEIGGVPISFGGHIANYRTPSPN